MTFYYVAKPCYWYFMARVYAIYPDGSRIFIAKFHFKHNAVEFVALMNLEAQK